MRRVFAWLTAVDACWFYRIKLPLEELARSEGWEVAWGEPSPDIHEYDVVIAQRLPYKSPEWEALCRNPNVLTVYEMDDDLLHIDPENTVPHQVYRESLADIERNVRLADAVITCTPYVTERMLEINDAVFELPICTHSSLIDAPLRTTPDVLTVGWAGSPFHHQDWVGLPEQLAEFRRRVPRAQLHMLGADYTRGLAGHVRVSGLQHVEAYYMALDLDIGLAPLLRSPHNRGKSHTKLLEYAARGIVPVATAWGQYVDWIHHGVNGLLIDRDDHWADAITSLALDDELRGRMSSAARASARVWTIDKHIHLWKTALGG